MGVSRVVNTGLWDDDMVLDTFSVEDRYFWLYLLTNPHTSQLGIYHLPRKKACVELGYSMDVLNVLLKRFEHTYGLIKFNEETSEVAVKNYLKYAILKGGQPVMDLLIKEEKQVKDKSLVEFVIDNLLEKIEQEEVTNKTVIEFVYLQKEKYQKKNNNDNDNEDSYYDSVDDSVDDSLNDSIAEETPQIKENKYQWLINAWNELSYYGVKSIININNKRLEQTRARINSYGKESILMAIDKIKNSKFLLGGGSRGWVIYYDWFIAPNNFPKVLEGNYDDRTTTYAPHTDNYSQNGMIEWQ